MYVGEKVITLEANAFDESIIVTMALVHDPVFALLQRLKQSPRVSQADAIRYLRTVLSVSPGSLRALDAVRKLKVSANTESESEQTHVTAKLGKSVMQSASGAETLPESIDVPTTVFLGVGPNALNVRLYCRSTSTILVISCLSQVKAICLRLSMPSAKRLLTR